MGSFLGTASPINQNQRAGFSLNGKSANLAEHRVGQQPGEAE
jgi:hypothetical protein